MKMLFLLFLLLDLGIPALSLVRGLLRPYENGGRTCTANTRVKTREVTWALRELE